MLNLLCEDQFGIVFSVFVVAIFVVAMACFIGVVVKKYREQQKQQIYQPNQMQSVQTKRDASEPEEVSHRNHSHVSGSIVADDDGHAHLADQEELYDDIVGSLGEVNDEGCEDLAGVRLISNDSAYEDDSDNSELLPVGTAMVLAEILNDPRSKMPYGKKHR